MVDNTKLSVNFTGHHQYPNMQPRFYSVYGFLDEECCKNIVDMNYINGKYVQ
jgi:hypothetical protein